MPQSKMRCRVQTIDHLVLTVRSIQDTLRFYVQTLGMERQEFTVADGSTRWALRFGPCKINLHEAGREFEPKAERPTPGSADLCFLTETPLECWANHFETLGIAIEEGPVPRTGATGPVTSLYIRDPDLNLIEVAVLAP